MPEPGFAVEFNVDPQGSELAADALATDTVLFVEDASGYDAPGPVQVNDVTYDLVASDVTAGTLTLATPLGVTAEVGDRVYIFGGGEIAYDYTLDIHTADREPLGIPIDFSDRALWGEPGPIDPPVPVVLSDDLAKIIDVPGRAALPAPSTIVLPRFVAFLDVNQSIPGGTGFTDVTGWVVQQNKGGMFYDGIASVQVPLDGSYSITGAVMWEINGTGRRSVQPAYDTSIGPFPGGLMNLAADGSARQTTPVVTPYKEALAGEWIKLTVSQTSGGALDLVGDALATKSFFCVKYEGPL